MGWSIVQRSAPGFVTATSSSVTLSNVAANDLLVVFAYANISGETLSISDTNSNSWTSGTNLNNPNVALITRVFFAVAKAGSTTITVSSTSSVARSCWGYDVSGLVSSNVLDVSSERVANAASTDATTASATTTQTDFLIGFASDTNGSNTMTASSPWTIEDVDAGFYAGSEVDNSGGAGKAAGSFNADLGLGGGNDADWNCHFYAFKLAVASIQPGADEPVANAFPGLAILLPESDAAWSTSLVGDMDFLSPVPNLMAQIQDDGSGFSFTPPPPMPSAEDDFIFYTPRWPIYLDDTGGFVPVPPPIQPSAEDDFMRALPTWIPHDVDTTGSYPIPGIEAEFPQFIPDGTLAGMVPVDDFGTPIAARRSQIIWLN